MVERAAFVRRMRGVAIWAGSVRRSAAVAAGLGLLFWNLASSPATAQVLRPGAAADPIQRSRDLSGRPRPTVTAPDQPTGRVVPESRQRESGTGREIVTPPYYERSTPDGTWQSAPPTSYGTTGSPPRLPGR
jgi:hypothetical protein